MYIIMIIFFLEVFLAKILITNIFGPINGLFFCCATFLDIKRFFVDACNNLLMLRITYWENFERAFHVVLQGYLFARHPWDHSVGRCVRFFPSFFRSIAVNQFNIHDQFYIHFDINDD